MEQIVKELMVLEEVVQEFMHDYYLKGKEELRQERYQYCLELTKTAYNHVVDKLSELESYYGYGLSLYEEVEPIGFNMQWELLKNYLDCLVDSLDCILFYLPKYDFANIETYLEIATTGLQSLMSKEEQFLGTIQQVKQVLERKHSVGRDSI